MLGSARSLRQRNLSLGRIAAVVLVHGVLRNDDRRSGTNLWTSYPRLPDEWLWTLGT